MKHLVLLPFVILLLIPAQVYAISDSSLLKRVSLLEKMRLEGIITNQEVSNNVEYLLMQGWIKANQLSVISSVWRSDVNDLKNGHYEIVEPQCLWYRDQPTVDYSVNILNIDGVDHKASIQILLLDDSGNVIVSKDQGIHTLHLGQNLFVNDEVWYDNNRFSMAKCDLKIDDVS